MEAQGPEVFTGYYVDVEASKVLTVHYNICHLVEVDDSRHLIANFTDETPVYGKIVPSFTVFEYEYDATRALIELINSRIGKLVLLGGELISRLEYLNKPE